ncbi:MAG TPA: hypothetical protein VNC50_13530 [Planctomycetia bacterium]|nr:hypothetical protein [Planctomycetia bacterium]
MEPGSASEPAAPPAGAERDLPPESRRSFWLWLAAGALLPGAILFGRVLVADENFVYRDAGHFYYPYFKLIDAEWKAGRIPLWNPYENGGEPLAAQPTASVFYPGKILFFLLPYGAAFKAYHLIHWAIAWGATYVAARGFGARRGGATLAALAYSCSGFVLFQLYNIVFLVGAAWVPAALLAIHRLATTGSAASALALAVIAALQILGGDPQAATIELLVAGFHILFVRGGRAGIPIALALLALGHGAVRLASWFPPLPYQSDSLVEPTLGERASLLFAAFDAHPALVARSWSEHARKLDGLFFLGAYSGIVAPAVGFALLFWKRRQARALIKDPAFRRLLLAGVGAACLAAIQILPSRDLVAVSDRNAPEAPHESAAFSLFPLRLAELFFPAVFGTQLPRNTRWFPFSNLEPGLWTASLYLGVAPVLLALFAFRARGAAARLLAALALVSLWLALGKFGGWHGYVDGATGREKAIDAPRDSKVYGDSSGLYRLCEETLPVFASFRYPEKLFVFTVAGLALAAGLAFDRVRRGGAAERVAWTFAAVAGALLLAALALRGPFERWVAGLEVIVSAFGPLDPAEAWSALAWSLGRAAAATLAAAALLRWAPSRALRPLLVGAVALDLSLANRWLVLVDSQAALDAKPKLAEAIEAAEAKSRGDGPARPFRIHRTRNYAPIRWIKDPADGRVAEMARWERDTLQPKYALPWRIETAQTTGTMSIYDVEFFFAPWAFTTPPELRAQGNRVPPKLTYFPRTGYDLWGAKYFVLPKLEVLDDEERGTFTMRFHPDGRPLPVLAQSAADADDFLLLENPYAFPRAWVVHAAEFIKPISGLRRADRQPHVERLVYRPRDAGLAIWNSSAERVEFPLRSSVMLESAQPAKLTDYISGGPTAPSETPIFRRYEPGRVEIEVSLERPGFLVLADAYFAGWQARSGDRTLPILRANRAMRAVPLPAGKHVVEFVFTSRSFVIGAIASALAWAVAALLSWRRFIAGRANRSISQVSG